MNKKQKKNKREVSKKILDHFKNRFMERYGIIPTKEMRKRIKNKIKNRELPVIDIQSEFRYVYGAILAGYDEVFPVVYDRKVDQLITVLPQCSIERLKN